MGRISLNDVTNYEKTHPKRSGGSDFFQIKEDRASRRVRFMYEGVEDIKMDLVHEVEIDGKKRFVSCLREYGGNMDDCPLCSSGDRNTIRMFVPVYDIEDKKAKIWQRGRTFASAISGLASRYHPLCSQVIDVERHGKPGDTQTEYALYPVDGEKVDLKELPPAPNVYGTIVLEKTYDQLRNFVECGEFDPHNEAPKRRLEY